MRAVISRGEAEYSEAGSKLAGQLLKTVTAAELAAEEDNVITLAAEQARGGVLLQKDAAALYAKIEKEHEERYLKLLENVEGGLVFSREGDMIWQCSNCGHIVIGKQAPEVCPVCAHPQAYFEIKAENY